MECAVVMVDAAVTMVLFPALAGASFACFGGACLSSYHIGIGGWGAETRFFGRCAMLIATPFGGMMWYRTVGESPESAAAALLDWPQVGCTVAMMCLWLVLFVHGIDALICTLICWLSGWHPAKARADATAASDTGRTY
jgi:hypothetical protein